MSGRLLVSLIDSALGWRSRSSGAVSVGQGATIAWRRIRRVAGNRLSIGDGSIIHADISFEEMGGEIRIGSRTFIGRSNLVCYRRLIIGDDVIMSWGVTIVDHDSHSIDWTKRENDVREWGRGRKAWDHVAHAPVTIADKVWIGFNVSVLKGVTIEEGAVVGACSVVTRDIPAYSLAAGNPARVIRTLR
jgi:acetyltransferase-like isoleucine patch superfamily enzyme